MYLARLIKHILKGMIWCQRPALYNQVGSIAGRLTGEMVKKKR